MVMAIILLILPLLIYFTIKYHYTYWRRRNVPGPKPKLLFGNTKDVMFLKKSLGTIVLEIYNNLPDVPAIGIFRGLKPTLILKDTNLIKEVLIKNFSSFDENEMKVDIKVDPLIGRNPFFVQGELWKTYRSQLMPCFSIGKMKILLPLLIDNSKNMIKYVEKQIFDKIEAKNLSLKYTLNNVASCAFGLEAECFTKENPFFLQLADELLNPSSWRMKLIFFSNFIPHFDKFVSLRFATENITNKFTKLITDTINYRKNNNIVRNDFLQIIQESSKLNDISDMDVVAHCAAFLLDGYETSSVVISFFLFNLANNPNVQTQLRNEINEQFIGNDLTYEMIQNMPYLDACLNESLRLYPPVLNLGKVCTKNFKYNNLTIEKGTSLMIPVYALQNDPKYYPNPESYNPNRFLDNTNKIDKATFLPFGDGPRICIGQKFGVLQIKIGIIYLIKNFELSVNKKTQLPIKLDPVYILALPIGGLWIDFKKL